MSGIAGVLSADRLGRARGRGVGGQDDRARAGAADAAGRRAIWSAGSRAAPLFAQLRYAGPADTLVAADRGRAVRPVGAGRDRRGRARARRRPGDPRRRARANGARIESATTGTVLTNVQASGRFARIAAADRPVHRGCGQGRARHRQRRSSISRPRDGIGLDLTAAGGPGGDDQPRRHRRDRDRAADVHVERARAARSRATWRSTSSRYRLGQATAASAVPQLNIREINLPDGGEEDDAPDRRRGRSRSTRARRAR